MPGFTDILEGIKALPKAIYTFFDKYFRLLLVSLIPFAVAVIIGSGGTWILCSLGLEFDAAKIFMNLCVTLSQIYMLAFCVHNDSESEAKTFDGYFPISILILYLFWSL